MSYGERIPDLILEDKLANYGVVNEREIRTVTGLMFAIGISTFFLVVLANFNFLLLIVVPLFLLEFGLKTFIAPNYSILLQFVRPLTKNQKPDYVGAIQKRFAWFLGFIMASLMLIVISLGISGIIPMLICGTCLVLMWLESAAGICIGCKLYSFLIKKGIIPAPDIKPVCAGGVCSID